MDLAYICKQVRELAEETAGFIMRESYRIEDLQAEAKGFHDFVTYMDRASEERLVTGLSKILPEAGFIAEEGSGVQNAEEYQWIIDPIDGTTNFIHQLPPYSISIALMYRGAIILGVVYEMTADECFYAWKGGNAYLNSRAVQVTEINEVEKAFVATGFPYKNFERIESYMNLLQYLMQHTPGVRRLGSAAVDLVYVACGRFEAFFEYNLKSWDVAAGAFIVQQAGGAVSDFSGGNNYLFGREVIASNQVLHPSFLKVVNRFMA